MSRKKSYKKAHKAQKQKTIKDGISFVCLLCPFVALFAAKDFAL
jgi:hypothetical protein